MSFLLFFLFSSQLPPREAQVRHRRQKIPRETVSYCPAGQEKGHLRAGKRGGNLFFFLFSFPTLSQGQPQSWSCATVVVMEQASETSQDKLSFSTEELGKEVLSPMDCRGTPVVFFFSLFSHCLAPWLAPVMQNCMAVQVAKILRETCFQSHRTRKGGLWVPESVREILESRKTDKGIPNCLYELTHSWAHFLICTCLELPQCSIAKALKTEVTQPATQNLQSEYSPVDFALKETTNKNQHSQRTCTRLRNSQYNMQNVQDTTQPYST